MGWTEPASLLAYITEIRRVSGRCASRGRPDRRSLGVDRDAGDGKAQVFQPVGSVEHGVVLETVVMMWGAGPLGVRGGARRCREGQVVAFGAAAGKEDLGGLAAENAGDAARARSRAARASWPRVDAGGIAEAIGEVGQHRVKDGGKDGRGGRVVEVDGAGRGGGGLGHHSWLAGRLSSRT